jgi:hypothetical protein
MDVRIMWRILYPVLLVVASLMLAVFYPVLLLIFYAGAFVLILLSRSLNFYKIVVLLERAARNLGARLRYEMRIRLHFGFRDYSDLSGNADEELHQRTHGYVR